MQTLLSVVGTRPEAIKMSPVILEANRYPDELRSIVCSTGQHTTMLSKAFDIFGVEPDIELNVMQNGQGLSALTSRLIDRLDPVIREVEPDWIIAQGDTTTVFVASLLAFYNRISFGHVEAGLRTNDPSRPFPEEINRRFADQLSDVMFAPTGRAYDCLIREGYAEEKIMVTGNTVVDAVRIAQSLPYDMAAGPLANIPTGKRLVLVTAHRREALGETLDDLCMAVRDIAELFSGDDVHIVFPVHPNPKVGGTVHKILGAVTNITLLENLDYLSLLALLKRTTLVLTDSGGIQEEAPAFGVPVLVMRTETERMEGVDAGVSRLVGTDRQRIVREATELLTDVAAYARMSNPQNPYGDGKAAERIIGKIRANEHAEFEYPVLDAVSRGQSVYAPIPQEA